MALPLQARGRTAGVLTYVRGTNITPYGEDDLELGRDLAARAALALDNAMLFSELRAAEGRMEAILDNLGEAVGALSPDGSFVFANDAVATLAGVLGADQLLASSMQEVVQRLVFLDESGQPISTDDLPPFRVLAGEEAPEPTVARVVNRQTGDDRWVIMRAAPVRDASGALELVVTVNEDVTLVKRQEARQRLLANASKLLTSSLDVGATVDKAAWAAVPELADWARIDLLDDRGRLCEAAVAHRDLEHQAILSEWRRRYPPDPADERGPHEVLRSGAAVVWTKVCAEDVVRYAQDNAHADMMRIVDTRSVIIVPLTAGERVLGTLQLATTGDSGRMLTQNEVELAEELARRAAIAVENARLHAARTHIATTLQRSLLPPRLPVIPGLTIAARFRAAGPTSEVGGDFYDLFAARNGWMVIMGDVTGKGPAAAAITSLARYTMRTAAGYEDDPRAVLERLNGALGGEGDHRRLCTAVCVAVQQTVHGTRLEIACAGHPAPLLIRASSGEVRPVGPPGTLLGAFPEGHWHAESVDLEPGDAVVLYTDGVTDTRGPHGRFGSDRLEAVLRDLDTREPDEIAGRIDRALQDFGEQRDDVALLVLGADPSTAGEATIVGTHAAGEDAT
jgi:PAS domain S-box-containing protein